MLIIEIDDTIINDALLTRELLLNKDGTQNHDARLALSLLAHDKIRKP